MHTDLTYRFATKDDLPKIVDMLLDDPLGALREKSESVLSEAYYQAFEKIRVDANQELTIVELNGEVVGTYHLTFIQYLTHQGGLRAQIEAVRVASSYRGQGIGKKMFHYASERAKEKGCYMVQLTTDKQRPEAIKFYKSLGYVATHEGMKLKF
ncbi:MAG: GNAT family N-acetyltransferase [Pedobacter sp.]|nr:MAG: GNAT family N-acetyltransferase [Pedobacter sp.]